MSDLTSEPDDEAARRIREFLAGLPADAASLMAAFEQMQTAEEAELPAHGIHPVSVVHADVESAEDERLVFGELPRLAREAGQVSLIRGGNDYTTWFFDSERAALAFIAEVTAIAQSWWIVTPTALPQFYR